MMKDGSHCFYNDKDILTKEVINTFYRELFVEWIIAQMNYYSKEL